MAYDITLIPGDGIGPEISDATRRCIDATGVKINWDIQEAGADVIDKYKTPLPDHVVQSIEKNKVALKGPITTPIGTGFRSVNVSLRQKLDLFACVRPCKSYAGIKSPFKNVNLVLVRENTEDLYAGIEFQEGTPEVKAVIDAIEKNSNRKIRPDSGVSIKPISKFGSERIVEYAFQYALKNSRKKVTSVTKANIMKFTDGLFMKVSQDVAKRYEGKMAFDERLIDAICMQLVLGPENFDVIVLPNLYGDILSDLCAGLVGGLGVAPGANIGTKSALFEPTHGSAPKYKGQNKVNPTAMILSGVLMLRHLNEIKAADALENAVAAVMAEGKHVTYDIKRTNGDSSEPATTSGMADAIIKNLK